LSASGRNFWAVLPSLFATSMGLMAVLPTLALYVEERFHIADKNELTRWSGAIYGMAPLTAAIAGPIWGGLGDRLGRKPMAIRANLAIAATMALMPLATTPLWLLLLRAVQGLFAGYVAPAMALVSAETPAERQGHVIGLLQVGMAMGSLLGPAIGAEVAHVVGLGALFWVTSGLALLATVPMALLAREVRQERLPEQLSFVRELWTSSLQMLKNRVFAMLLLVVLLMRLGQNMLEPFVALFVRELGPLPMVAAWTGDPDLASKRTLSLAFGILAVAQFVFTPFWGRLSDRIGPLRCLAVVASALGVLLSATAAVQTIGQFALLRSLSACFMAGSMTLAYAAASKRVVAARRTLAFSMVQSCMQFGFALGPMGGSWLVGVSAADPGAGGHPDLRLLFAIAGGLCLCAAVGMIWLRRLPAGRAESAPPAVGESIGP
jgi:DHA1 family multidrug resistance protein-like MFS transporter